VLIDALAMHVGMPLGPLAAQDQRGRGDRHDEYPADGDKFIRPKPSEPYHKPEIQPSHEDIKDRILFRQVIESLKCLQEGVLHSVADGNIGSLLGIGAPTWTGGFIQFVNTYGLHSFIDRCRELAANYGDRFTPPDIAVEKAAAGGTFE